MSQLVYFRLLLKNRWIGPILATLKCMVRRRGDNRYILEMYCRLLKSLYSQEPQVQNNQTWHLGEDNSILLKWRIITFFQARSLPNNGHCLHVHLTISCCRNTDPFSIKLDTKHSWKTIYNSNSYNEKTCFFPRAYTDKCQVVKIHWKPFQNHPSNFNQSCQKHFYM